MADNDEFAETTDRPESGAAPSPSGGDAPIASPRPPILSRVRVPSRAENPPGGFTRDRLPDILQRAKDFYARHPTLVLAAGTVAAAAIARRLFRGRPGLF